VAERYIAEYNASNSTQIDSVYVEQNEDNELIFLGMNITEAVLDSMLKTKKKVTQGMSSKELKAYEMGISNTLSYLQVLLNDTDLVVVNTYCKLKEFTYEDLKKYYFNSGMQTL
jgi:hypothetical protein